MSSDAARTKKRVSEFVRVSITKNVYKVCRGRPRQSRQDNIFWSWCVLAPKLYCAVRCYLRKMAALRICFLLFSGPESESLLRDDTSRAADFDVLKTFEDKNIVKFTIRSWTTHFYDLIISNEDLLRRTLGSLTSRHMPYKKYMFTHGRQFCTIQILQIVKICCARECRHLLISSLLGQELSHDWKMLCGAHRTDHSMIPGRKCIMIPGRKCVMILGRKFKKTLHCVSQLISQDKRRSRTTVIWEESRWYHGKESPSIHKNEFVENDSGKEMEVCEASQRKTSWS